MPIYKAKGKKDGLQKYQVRVNYTDSYGAHKQLSRIAYGFDMAKNLEMRLNYEVSIKQEMRFKKYTVEELLEEYLEVKRQEIRETSVQKIQKGLQGLYPAYIR